MTQTKNSGWLAYTVTVAVALAAAGFILFVYLVFRGHHSEVMEDIVSASTLIVLFGGPTAALFGTVARYSARRQNLAIPNYARYAVYCAWGLAICLVIYILAALALTYASLGIR